MRKSVLNSVNKVCLIVFLITGFTLPLGTTAVVAPTDAYADFYYNLTVSPATDLTKAFFIYLSSDVSNPVIPGDYYGSIIQGLYSTHSNGQYLPGIEAGKTGSYTIAIPDSYAMQLEWWTVLALYTDELGNSGIHIASDVIDVGNL